MSILGLDRGTTPATRRKTRCRVRFGIRVISETAGSDRESSGNEQGGLVRVSGGSGGSGSRKGRSFSPPGLDPLQAGAPVEYLGQTGESRGSGGSHSSRHRDRSGSHTAQLTAHNVVRLALEEQKKEKAKRSEEKRRRSRNR